MPPHLHLVPPDPGTSGPALSAGAFSGELPGGTDSHLARLLTGRPCDPRAFQRLYPDRWSAFLRAHFRNGAEVAVFFDVDDRTARQWMEGVSAPRGWAASFAVISIPGAAGYLLEAA